jgi:hypothetical protein
VEPPPHVDRADADTIEVSAADEAVRPLLFELGFTRHQERPDELVRRVYSDEEKAEVFAALRDAGLYFSWGKEWNPVEVFRYLCDKGLLKAPFATIRWLGPDKIVLQKLP